MATKKKEAPDAGKDMNIHERLVFIQQNLKAPKGQVNSFGNYSYRSCEDILEAVKPLLGDASLVVTDEIVHFKSDRDPLILKVTDSKGNVSDELVGGDRFYVKATASLSKGTERIQGVAWARETDSKKGMDDAQVTGASSSYARKYALNGLFAIDDTKDADTMDNTQSGGNATPSSSASSQKELMEKFGMDTNQKAPACPSCGTKMNLVQRKDGSNLFWSCVNWRSKGCKGLNVDDVDIDGNITGKGGKKAVSANPQSDEDANDIPF